MSQLSIEGFDVPVAVGSTYEVAPWGDYARAFSGRQRSDIRARHRTFRVTTVELETGDALALQGLLMGPQPVSCDGDLVDGPTMLFARNARVTPLTATDFVLSFELHDRGGA